jgi:Xaa-Pro aminopeptidase
MAAPLEITPEEHAARREAFASRLRDEGLAGAVLFDTPHVQYLCGAFLFPTERPIAFVLSAEGEPGLLVPRLELEHARTQTGLERIEHYLEYPGEERAEAILARHLEELGIRGKIGADADGYPWILGYRGPTLSELTGAEVVLVGGLLDDQMAIKSEAEIRLIREAARWGDRAHRLLQGYTKVGEVETAVSLRASLEATIEMLDALGSGYRADTIFADGAQAGYRGQIGRNAAIPHAHSGNISFQEGDVLVTGAWAPMFGYHSELERTMVIGEASAEQRRLFGHMKAAQEIAFDAILPGARCADVDRAVRAYYEEHDLQRYWKHHTGHAIGLRYHEGPFLDSGDDTEIRTGMVFTVEPGLYDPDVGGFRHSDTVLVTDTGIDSITGGYPRDLESLTLPA